MITSHSIEYLKSQLDIVEVISYYIPLNKRGSSYVACCPFHTEKTPSFHVNASRGFFHCFGCGKSGNSITFVMEFEKINYPQAIEKLASIFNVTLKYTEVKEKKQETKILEHLKNFYKNNLLNTPLGLEAKNYLLERGVNEDSIQKFELGVVGEGHSVLNFLRDNGLDMQEALEYGILGVDTQNNNRRYYARLTHRIIFPITNPFGKIVGFGGRTLNNHPAKYINSPQTKLFNKSKLFYGYSQARESIYKKKEVIICEGYLDVILLHQVGFHNAVATLGTALTKDHLPLLSKEEPSVIMAYDGDIAGKNAAFKASQLLALNHKDGGVVIFDKEQDPADMVKSGQIQKLNTLFSSPKSFVLFVLEEIIASFDIKNPIQKENALKNCTQFLRGLSEVTQLEFESILETLMEIPSNLISLSNQSPKQQKIKKLPVKSNDKDLAEKSIVKSLIHSPELLHIALEYLSPALFTTQKEAYEAILREDMEHPSLMAITLDEVAKILPEVEFKRQINGLLIICQQEMLKKRKLSEESSKEWEECTFILRKLMEKRQNLIEEIRKR